MAGTAGTDGIKFPDGTLQTSSAAGALARIQQGTASGAGTIAITGLNGDTDIEYVIELQGTISTNADRWIYVTPNNATGATHFSHQHRLDASAGNVAEAYSSLQGILIGRTVYSQSGTISLRATLFAQSGYYRQATSSCVFYASQAANGLANIQGTWADSATNITSLTINFNGGTFTGRWRLYAPR